MIEVSIFFNHPLELAISLWVSGLDLNVLASLISSAEEVATASDFYAYWDANWYGHDVQ